MISRIVWNGKCTGCVGFSCRVVRAKYTVRLMLRFSDCTGESETDCGVNIDRQPFGKTVSSFTGDNFRMHCG